MYSNLLSYKIKSTSINDNHRIVDIFFKAWIDDICDNNVNITEHNNYIEVKCNNEEDIVFLKLNGLPDELRKYIELVN